MKRASAGVRELAAEFERVGFFDLPSVFLSGGSSHTCGATLTVTIGSRQHVVRTGLSGRPPDGIVSLVSRLETLARIDRFEGDHMAAPNASPPVGDLGVYANLLERSTWVWAESLQLQARLKATQVSTQEAAERLAWSAFNGRGGVGPNDLVQLSGLYEVGRTIEGFAAPQDLVWEARLLARHRHQRSDVDCREDRRGAALGRSDRSSCRADDRGTLIARWADSTALSCL